MIIDQSIYGMADYQTAFPLYLSQQLSFSTWASDIVHMPITYNLFH